MQHLRRDQRVCVLGGTGFIGRTLSRQLADRGHHVVSLGRRTGPASDHIAPVAMDLTTADPSEIASLLRTERIDAIVNAAGGMWGLTEPEMVAVNTVLVDKLIEAVALAGNRPRLIHLGTVHEYGVSPVGAFMTEQTPALPVMAYGELKLRCTEAVTKAAAGGEIDGVSLRIGNVIGAWQPSTSLLGVVAKQLADRPAEVRLGPLGSLRDFIGLDSTCAAIIAVLDSAVARGEVINIGRGVAAPAREMVELLIRVSGVTAELIEAPATQEETTWQCMETTLAGQLLGWTPDLDLTADMEQLWHTYTRADNS